MRYFLLAVSLLLTSCMHIPVSTMYKMATYDWRRIEHIDPYAYRAYLDIEGNTELDLDSVRMKMQLTSPEGIEDLSNGLVLVSYEYTEASDGFWSSNKPHHAYEFKLSEDGIRAFQFVQTMMRNEDSEESDEENKESYGLDISLKYSYLTIEPKSKVTVSFFVDDEMGKITMFKNMPIELDQTTYVGESE